MQEELKSKTVCTKAVFHSVTLPRKIKYDEAGICSDSVEGQKNVVKNRKYEVYILYRQPKTSKAGGYIMKRKKLLIGNKKVTDFSDGQEVVNSLTAKSMRTRLKKQLIDQPTFDRAEVEKMGGFLSRQFWQNNLLWGNEASLIQNLAKTADLVHAVMPEQNVSAASLARAKRISQYSGNATKFKKSGIVPIPI